MKQTFIKILEILFIATSFLGVVIISTDKSIWTVLGIVAVVLSVSVYGLMVEANTEDEDDSELNRKERRSSDGSRTVA